MISACDVSTYEEMLAYCEERRGYDRFCLIDRSCSGPTYSNLAFDHPYPEGKDVFRGGCLCRFVVDK